MVNLMMETHVTSGAHCLLLLSDPVMVNLACFMVSNGCHQRLALSLYELVFKFYSIDFLDFAVMHFFFERKIPFESKIYK